MTTLLRVLPFVLLCLLSFTAPAIAGGNAISIVVSNTDDSGAGSLRQAIIDSNANTSPNRFNVVEFTVTGTISLQSALPASNQRIALRGPGADKLTVERGAAANFQLLSVNAANSLVEGLTFKNGNNPIGSGGGLFIGGNGTVVRGCVFTGNSAADGGGVFMGGTGTLVDCEVTGNTATNDGAGVGCFGSANIFNCTITGNSATNRGGGIFLNSGLSSILHCTLSGNSAANGGGMFLGSTTVTSCIAADNTATGTGPDINTTTAAITFSLVKDAAGSTVVDGTSNNRVADPQLGTLQANGGTTKTMAITGSSPAANAGTSAFTSASALLGPECFDQRGLGFARFHGAAPDMGAFEVQEGATFTPNSLNDAGVGSLREAITNANAAAGFNTIDLSGLSGTISLSTALPQVTDGVHFKGPGADKLTVERGGAANFRVFDLNLPRGLVVQFSGLTISKGNADTGDGGGVLLATGSAGYSEPCLLVTDCAVKGNTATRGGAIAVPGRGILLVSGSELSGNTATGDGGAINIRQVPSRDQAALLMENSTISGNTSGGAGGGLSLVGNYNRLRFVTIANNTATGVGGGLSGGTSSNTLEIYNSILADNSSGSGGADWNGTTRQDFVRNNIVEDSNATLVLVNGTNGNILTTDPGLSPLALASGASTQTQEIGASSPASEVALLFPQVTKDQRGFTRPTDKQDLGAFEVGGTAPAPSTTSSSSGSGAPLRGPGRNEDVIIKGDKNCSLGGPESSSPAQGAWLFALLALSCLWVRRQS